MKSGPRISTCVHGIRVVAVREPGAAIGSLAQDVRSVRGLEDAGGQPAGTSEIVPYRRGAPQAGPHHPARGNRLAGVVFRSGTEGLREGGHYADEPPQLPAHLAEVEVRLEVLHEVENVALGRALRVPPAAAVMVDDQYLALLAAIFEGTTRAFPPVKLPRRRPPLEQRGTVHPSAELLELRILGLHLMVLLAGARAAGRFVIPFTSPSGEPATAKPAAGQGRQRRPQSGFPCGADGSTR